jgi:hypothetical protein
MRGKCLILIALLTIPVLSETPRCKGNPKVVGECFTVHGRARFGSGTPSLRIWPIGTKRMLGVAAGPVADDADAPICPNEMLRWPAEEYGDFEVCPFTEEKPGHMQMVCVESVSHLIVHDHSTKP